MGRNNRPKKVQLPQEIADFAAEIAQIQAQNAKFEQEKDNMLCTIACLVQRLGGMVVIGQQDAETINLWRDNKIELKVEQIDIAMGRPSFKFTVVHKDVLPAV